MKNFYRKEKLSQHHLDNHGGGCVLGCKKQGGLCEPHLNRSVFELPPKKAWGCPCCLRCFDTFEAWTKHGGNHPIENDKIVGWSLRTMVESLVHQPYLKDAVAHLPWHACDPTKVKADICQSLREALERHKLPDAVQDHYDYRIDYPSGNGQGFQTHDQALYPTSTAPPGEAALSSHNSGSLNRMARDADCSERRRRALNTEKPLPNLVHLPSSTRLQPAHMDPVPLGTPLYDGAAPEISQQASTPEDSKDSVRIELMDATPNSPRHARMSSRMSFQWEAWVDLPPEELHDP